MNHRMFISSITELQKDFKRQFLRICQYHQMNSEKTYYASEHIVCMLEYIKFFYEKEQIDDRTSKKALVFEMMNAYSGLNLPTIPMAYMFKHSPIEHLFYISLSSTMPEHIWELSYLIPQKKVCDNKYYIDFALCDRKTGKVQIGVECDGFHIHYSTPKKVENNNMRDREIKRLEGFDIWHYSGSEIYHSSLTLAKEFWQYVSTTFYPND